MLRPKLIAAACCLLTVPLVAQPPNLVTNGDFDSDMAGWGVFGEFPGIPGGDATAVSYAPGIDGLNQPGSGAVRLSGQIAFTQVGQCIQLDPTVSRYTDGVALTGDANAQLFLGFYSDTDCQIQIGGGGGFQTSQDFAEFSFRINTFPGPPPLNSRSAWIAFGQQSGADLENLFDKAFLIEGLPEDFPPLTAEVELLENDHLRIELAGTGTGGFVPFEGEYRWDFGDGTTTTGRTVSHTYAAAGTYFVQLTVLKGYEQGSTFIEVSVSGVNALDIPTLHQLGLVLLALLLLSAALVLMQRRS